MKKRGKKNDKVRVVLKIEWIQGRIQGRLQGLRTGVDSNWFGMIYMSVFIGSYRIAYRFLECSRARIF